MARYFHGTTIENAIVMMSSNFHPDKKPSGTWTCSDDYFFYLWSFDKIANSEFDYTDDGYDEEERYIRERDVEYRCIQDSFESASITAALNNVLRRELVVFEFEFDDELQDDLSAQNMADTANMINLTDVSSDNIRAIYLCEDGYEPMYRVFHLHGLMGHKLINLSKLSTREVNAIRAVTSDFYPNEYGFDWVPVDRTTLFKVGNM